MLSAAKEETFSAFGPWCAETCISASKCEGEKPHQGVASKNPALHQGITWSNSTTALGLRGARLETRVRSRCTGKERDSESNLDMFGARYYGSSLGRFMTPDWAAKPTAVPYAHYGNPQSLNLYSYVQNNPTTIGDPDGHWPTFRLGGTWTHSDIVDAAYPGLSAAQRQIIKNGSAKADEDQSRAGAPAHGMTPKGEDKAIAMRDAAKIVANSESAARNDQAAYTAAGGKGIADSALSAVAPAFHEQTDETSPAHAGFQEWGGMGEGNAIQQLQEVAAGAEHAARESSATPEEKAASIAAAQRVLQSVLPPDLYQKAITPPKQQ